VTRFNIDGALLIGLPVIGVFLAWGALEGGYNPTVWYAGGLFLLGLLVASTFASPNAVSPPRPTVLALGFLAALALWSLISITWADVQGDAWDGANRTLLYLLVYALFVLRSWRPSSAATLVGILTLGIVGIGIGVLVQTSMSDDPESAFLRGRLIEPLGYENADAAFFLLAFWPALLLSARREVPIFARALFLGAAGAAVELAVLSQSRGSLFAFPIVLALYFAIVPGRVRSLISLIPVAIVFAVASGRLLDVYDSFNDASIDAARNAILISFVALSGIGFLMALVDRGLAIPQDTAERLNRAAGIAALSAAVIAAAAVLVIVGNPVERVASAWDQFQSGPPPSTESSRFLTLGSNRYDVWRVAWAEFRESPVRGVGADNFATDYIRERRANEEPRYAHSVELMVLAQTGVVGALLFLGFLVCALGSVWRARRTQGPFARALAGGLVIMFAYWFVHGSVDWFWEFPALGAIAFMCLAIAGRLGSNPEEESEPGREGRLRRRALLVGLIIVTGVTVVSFTPPWLAARYVEQAARGWRVDSAASYTALERARKLNLLSDRPDVFAGTIAARRHEWARATDAFERALQRNPTNWYARLELGVLEAMSGRRAAALEELRTADELNPRDPLIDFAIKRVSARRPVSLDEINQVFQQRVENRFGLDLD
jgi:O-antigen ligase